MSIRVVSTRGAPRERGRQHGEALREAIGACVAIYRAAIPGNEAALRARAAEFGAEVARYAPDLADEIEGIAEGADLDPLWIHVLNARSEMMSSADGCTAVFSPSAGLLGQTWDWIEPLEKLFFVLRVERPDGHRIATVTEPGIVGKIGLSTAGLGCTLNFLLSPGKHAGTPVHVLLRSLLEARDVDDARARIDARTPGQSGNLILGSVGAGFDAELAGEDAELRALGPEPFAHTNHHLWRPLAAGALQDNSDARLSRACERIQAGAAADAGAMMSLLSDTSDRRHPICAGYQPLLGSRIGTLCTVVMELGAGRMHVRQGPDPTAPFEAIAV